ncbi:MAG: hypothetical protein COA84_07675 [Robiginitomaculum sp.]|nr:MAG: hypothetical protein COA84_07675 [Robiginitomaculum sp.]
MTKSFSLKFRCYFPTALGQLYARETALAWRARNATCTPVTQMPRLLTSPRSTVRQLAPERQPPARPLWRAFLMAVFLSCVMILLLIGLPPVLTAAYSGILRPSRQFLAEIPQDEEAQDEGREIAGPS